MLVKIKRQDKENSQPYWQTFEYNGSDNVSVASVLDTLNNTKELVDTDGKEARRIKWECSCLQKMCGACAMVICGVPALACNTFVSDLKAEELVIEPLSKFPVICDLCVDRGIIQNNLIDSNAFLGKAGKIGFSENSHRYLAGKCLKCGLCLEVCPNYKKGERFYGATFANDMYLLHSGNSERKKDVKKEYKQHFYKGCSRCLSCQKVCPMELPIATSMGKMNRIW